MSRTLEYTVSHSLTAAQCNAQRELAPAQLVQQLIEAATCHADSLDFGFRRLQSLGILWVLSRISFKMDRYPQVFETYSITTWVESFNRHFSERNYMISGADGQPIGYAHTVWMAIDLRSRRPADLSVLGDLNRLICDRPCPVGKGALIRRPENPDRVNPYTFQVSDIDCNRHVNSARYVELVINQMELPIFDRNLLQNFEIAYKHEARFGDSVTVESQTDGETVTTAIMAGDTPACLARYTLTPRTPEPCGSCL